jgi:hypothetical protein
MILRILLDSDLVFKLNENLNLKGIFAPRNYIRVKVQQNEALSLSESC